MPTAEPKATPNASALEAKPTSNGEADRFPAGVPFIVGNEGAERFSYYGMRAILYTYLASLYVKVGEIESDASSHATSVTHLFMAGVYAFPMLGAILADRLLGKFNVIFFLSLVYCAGHAVLAFAGRADAVGAYGVAELGMYGGLALIAIGSGGIKPCVSANVGDQFSSKNAHLVPKVFQIFYFIINFGSFFSTILTPIIKKKLGPEVAFGIPGVFMAIATLIFYLGRKRFVRLPPKPGGKVGLLDTFVALLLFSPVIAIILTVFVEGHHFSAPSPVLPHAADDILAPGKPSGQFLTEYLVGYTTHLAVSSWPYFAVSAVLFGLAFVLFGVRQRLARDDGFLAVVVYSFKNRHKRKPGEGFFDVARAELGDEAAEGPPAVLRVMKVFAMVMFFWALFDQKASTWVKQSTMLDRGVTLPLWTGRFLLIATIAGAIYGVTWLMLWVSNRPIPRHVSRLVLGALGAFGAGAVVLDVVQRQTLTFAVEAQHMQALNPLLVMIIIPALNVLVYRPLEKRGREPKPLARMSVGMFLAAVAFALSAILQSRIELAASTGGSVHVFWQFGQYAMITTAEVLVSVTGLEFAYTQAPRRMKSTIIGFWLLGSTFGNVLVAFMAPMQQVLVLSQFFWVFTGLMTLAALAFTVLAWTYKGKTYLQSEAKS